MSVNPVAGIRRQHPYSGAMISKHGDDGRAGITAALVSRLLAEQFPRLAHLPVRPVPVDGHDNRTYRLGDDLTVRLPTADCYVAAVGKEHRWLPVLAPRLPVPIPDPVGLGTPSPIFPRPWSIRRWLPGDPADPIKLATSTAFAEQVAGFASALWRTDATGGPVAGAHSFHRGAPPGHYDDETRMALARLAGEVDTARATEVWQAALDAAYPGPPVWFHGDIAHGNLLTAGERLTAVIDFGTSGVGDPACDLVIAWTLFTGAARAAFRVCVDQPGDAWARARGWALWKALISLAGTQDAGTPDAVELNRRVLAEVLADRL